MINPGIVPPIAAAGCLVVDEGLPIRDGVDYHLPPVGGKRRPLPAPATTTRHPVTIDSKLDWRGGLLDAARRDNAAGLRATLARTIDQGVDAVVVQRFVAEHRAVFGDAAAFFDDVDASRRAVDRLLDQTQPRLAAPSSTSGGATRAGGVRAHAVRFDPAAALPWHQRVSLPALPDPFAVGPAKDLVIQGERLRPVDVDALLARC
jgi:hypothetical protein